MDLDQLDRKLNTEHDFEMCTSCYGMTWEGSTCLNCLGDGHFKKSSSLSLREQRELLEYAKNLEERLRLTRGYV